jgi:hypothetical protein
MSCDKLVFDLSQEIEGSPNVFVKKDWLNILDNQSSNYNSNQSVIDTSQLSNSNKYMSYREAFIAVPLLLTMVSSTAATYANYDPSTAASSADFAVGLKNWFGQIVHSATLDYNGTTIIQQTPYINMWNSFKLMTSLSWSDITTIGSTIGFYPDDPLAWTFQSAASVDGMGVCNNTNFSTAANGALQTDVSGQFNSYRSGLGNKGLLTRQMYINYDGAGVPGSGTYGALLSTGVASQIWKSYISNKQAGLNATNPGIYQVSIMATIYLRHLHSFFDSVPLLKGVFMKLTLNLNNTTTSFSSAGIGGALTLASVSNSVGGVNPVMIASARAGNGSSATFGATDFKANISVGATCLDSTISSLPLVAKGTLAQSVYLYVPAYTFNPVFEQAYLSSPVKKIDYTDVYQYQVLNVGANSQINSLLTNGIASVKSILIVPFYSSSVVGNTGLPTGIPVYQSPFDPAGCGCTSPLAYINNFNVVVSGQNAIYNTITHPGFEYFSTQFYGVNAVNGGCTSGLNSGIIDAQGWEMEYTYYYVDISRMLPVEESVPKSIQLVGQNVCAKSLDLFCFIEYGVSVSVDILTGARV